MQVIGTLDVAIGGVQRHPAEFLQMGRLSVNKQLVNCRDLKITDQTEVDPHPDLGKQVHGFFAADLL